MARSVIAVAVACVLGLLSSPAAQAGARPAPWRYAAYRAAKHVKVEEGRYQPSAGASRALARVGSTRLRALSRKLGFAARVREGSAIEVAGEVVRQATLQGKLGELEAALMEMAETSRVRAPRVRPKAIARRAGRALATIET